MKILWAVAVSLVGATAFAGDVRGKRSGRRVPELTEALAAMAHKALAAARTDDRAAFEALIHPEVGAGQRENAWKWARYVLAEMPGLTRVEPVLLEVQGLAWSRSEPLFP